ncbi:hypothetical protein ABH988_004770 [Bradyrhizobium ottawaense]
MMRTYLFAAAMITAVAAPALADEVGVHVGPVGAGVTVGQSHEYRERDPRSRPHHRHQGARAL